MKINSLVKKYLLAKMKINSIFEKKIFQEKKLGGGGGEGGVCGGDDMLLTPTPIELNFQTPTTRGRDIPVKFGFDQFIS